MNNGNEQLKALDKYKHTNTIYLWPLSVLISTLLIFITSRIFFPRELFILIGNHAPEQIQDIYFSNIDVVSPESNGLYFTRVDPKTNKNTIYFHVTDAFFPLVQSHTKRELLIYKHKRYLALTDKDQNIFNTILNYSSNDIVRLMMEHGNNPQFDMRRILSHVPSPYNTNLSPQDINIILEIITKPSALSLDDYKRLAQYADAYRICLFYYHLSGKLTIS